MIVNLDFNISAWVKQLNIEAISEKNAIDKLMQMTLAEIVAEGAIIHSDLNITDIKTDIVSYNVVVQVSNIKWALDPEIMDISVIEYLKNLLPNEFKVTLEDITDTEDLEDLIKDALFFETNYDVESFDFKILEKK